MAEATQGIERKWLLLVAVILGIVVVIIYNAHIQAIRSQQEGQNIEVVELRRDVDAGDRITPKLLVRSGIPRDQEKSFGNVVKWRDRATITARGGRRINRDLRKGQYLMWDYIRTGDRASPSNRLAEGMVAIPISFDSDDSLGDMLSVGDTISLKGIFPTTNGKYETYRIISGVRVLNLGGRGAVETPTGQIVSPRIKSYRKITIAVPENVSLKLTNLFTHMLGSVELELMPFDPRLPSNAGEINPELAPLAEKARLQGRRAPVNYENLN